MIAIVASILAAGFVGGAPLDVDPSLRIAPFHSFVTIADKLPAVVLEHKQTKLMWDETDQVFMLEVNNKSVKNLVTTTDSRGWPSFSGSINGAGVVGSVLLSGVPSSYTVELTLPGQKPSAFPVTHNGAPIVIGTRECDCSNNTDLSCTSGNYTDGVACPNSDGSTVCEWQTVASP